MSLEVLVRNRCIYCNGSKTKEYHLCPIPDFDCPGEKNCGEKSSVPCDDCEGTGYNEKWISVNTLITALESKT